jgi:hypothetical protein
MEPISTDNGSFIVESAADSARNAIGALHQYYINQIPVPDEPSLADASGDTSKWDKLGAIASVIGAITGVAGLAAGGDGTQNCLTFEIRNISDYYVVSDGAYREIGELWFSILPKPLGIGESSQWQILSDAGEGGFNNGDQFWISFAVGNSQSIIQTILYFKVVEIPGLGRRKQLTGIALDGKNENYPDITEADDRLVSISFKGSDDNIPSFRILTYSVLNTIAMSYILFMPY